MLPETVLKKLEVEDISRPNVSLEDAMYVN